MGGSRSGGGVVGALLILVTLGLMSGRIDGLPKIDLPDLSAENGQATGGGTDSTHAGSANTPARDGGPTPAPSARASSAALATLTVRDRPNERGGGYNRRDYGNGWVDTDGNGCTTRQDVLYAWVDKSKPYTAKRQNTCDHSMYAGTWVDAYNGQRHTFTNLKDPQQAQQLQVDHRVPLREADVSGASSWTREHRVTFANDPMNLVPVNGHDNTSKNSSDPAAWRPKKAHQCDYARRYIAVKVKYRLAVDASEKQALTQMLGTC